MQKDHDKPGDIRQIADRRPISVGSASNGEKELANANICFDINFILKLCLSEI